MRFILGPLIIVIGIALMKYSFWLTQQIGHIDFADRYLPSPLNGTYTWWKLVGLAAIVIALLWMGGILDFGGVDIPEGV